MPASSTACLKPSLATHHSSSRSTANLQCSSALGKWHSRSSRCSSSHCSSSNVLMVGKVSQQGSSLVQAQRHSHWVQLGVHSPG